MRRNSEGVPIWEWEVAVILWSEKIKDTLKVTTKAYHTNEAMAKLTGSKKIAEGLGLNFDEFDWGWKVEAVMSEDSRREFNSSTLTLSDVINHNPYMSKVN
jgi:hypothetical protein